MSDETAVTRRSFLSASGATVGSLVGLSAVTGTSRASHADATPDHIGDPVFDEALLEKHKPVLLTHDLDVEPSSIHGFVVRSEEKTTAALTYWAEYPVQLDQGGFASHIGDHEPFYRFVRYEGTSDEYIDEDVYSGYHWLAAETSKPAEKVYVFPDYHHYSVQKGRDSDRSGVDLPLKDLTNSLPRWLDDDDFHDSLAEDWNDRGSPAYNPWIMLDKASWWRKEGLSNYEQVIRKLWLAFGIRGAEEADL